jgi:hypothetical protein
LTVKKIFKALKLGKVTGLGCTLTSAECDYLIAHDDVLTQYITLLENDQLMKQRIAEPEAQQRWIPVSERLPEGRTVLVFKKDGSISIDTTYIDGGNYFWWESGQSKVTHWMPLPEPPEVNNE